MAKVLLTKRIEFSSSHRYQNDAWDAARNRVVFGACNNEPGHGHNYLLEVTLAGEVDPDTGMVVNLYDLKHVLKQVLEEFDHKHLNLDTPYFKGTIPTTENIAGVLWKILAARGEISPDTGKVTDIPTLDRLVQELVVRRFDHQDLNRDPDFSALVPTGENLTRLIWKRLAGSIPAARLDRIGLVETRGSSYAYTGETGEGALLNS